MNAEDIWNQLPFTLEVTHFDGLGERRQGKVRDIYSRGEEIVMITTDRVSAFDRVLGTIPFKGEILTQLALEAFSATEDILPNHVLSSPAPNVIVGRKCQPYPIEFVMRAYVTGSLWRDLLSGVARAYEVNFPAHLDRDERLPEPVLTPSTKAVGNAHDQPISKRAIVQAGLLRQDELDRCEEAARALFARGQARAEAQGLILVDTKYELGLDSEDRLTVIDEIHTPDSSRFWIANEYESRFRERRPQQMLDKENLRSWLLEEHGFSGQGEPPPLPDPVRVSLAERYIVGFERLTGVPFASEVGPVLPRLTRQLERSGFLSPTSEKS